MHSDRPLFVDRNSLYLPNRYNVDLRYTRIIPIHGSVRAEVIAELKNVFNTEQMSAFNSVVTTDAAGAPMTPIPTDPYSSRARPVTSSASFSSDSRFGSDGQVGRVGLVGQVGRLAARAWPQALAPNLPTPPDPPDLLHLTVRSRS